MAESNSARSALQTLTATYTDSEEEEEEVDDQPPSITSSPQVNSNSQDGNSGSSTSSSLQTRNRNAFGLVSYQDDVLDDGEMEEDYNNDSKSEDIQDATTEDNDVDMNDETKQLDNNDGSPNGDGVNSEQRSRRVKIPPEPPGKCSTELQERIARLYDRKLRGGLDMNKYIQCNKNFRNPSIYEKLIKHCNIDELGTNYPRDVYDPHVWSESSYYDELAKVQKAEMEKREKEKKERTKVEFQSGTVKKFGLPTAPAAQPDSDTKRKSKWDQRGVMPLMPIPPIQPVTVHPNITTSATGTKSTVISAFGNLPKKSK